jgi:hypothetical protein
MRKKLLAVIASLTVLAAVVVPLSSSISPAQAHVHGITPLLNLGCVVDNSVTGANRTDNTPAAAANGGPITGLIPRDVGDAPLTVGDGGRNAPVPVCNP